MQKRNLTITSQQTGNFDTGGAWTDVPQFIIAVPEDGNYDIIAQCHTYAPSNDRGVAIRLAIDLNPIEGTQRQNHPISASAITHTLGLNTSVYNIALKAGQSVSMQGIDVGTAGGLIALSGTTAKGSLQIIKRGV